LIFLVFFITNLESNSCTAVNRLNRTENYILHNGTDTTVLQANVFFKCTTSVSGPEDLTVLLRNYYQVQSRTTW